VIFARDDPLTEFKGGALAVNIAINSLILLTHPLCNINNISPRPNQRGRQGNN